MAIAASELITNEDGSIYHLALQPDQIAHDIITVGDPDRVDMVTKFFDAIEFTIQKREFKTTTGRLANKRLTVISTGIGTDNIDIVFNELDALVNIDLASKNIKDTFTELRFFRIGTSGGLQPWVDIDSYIATQYAIGFDGLLPFYNRPQSLEEIELQSIVTEKLQNSIPVTAQISTGNKSLIHKFEAFSNKGITITASGFYGPQGRQLRIEPVAKDYIQLLQSIEFDGLHTTNLEMETAGIYGLAKLLGHQAVSLNAIVANRALGKFSSNAEKTINTLISHVLSTLVSE